MHEDAKVYVRRQGFIKEWLPLKDVSVGMEVKTSYGGDRSWREVIDVQTSEEETLYALDIEGVSTVTKVYLPGEAKIWTPFMIDGKPDVCTVIKAVKDVKVGDTTFMFNVWDEDTCAEQTATTVEKVRKVTRKANPFSVVWLTVKGWNDFVCAGLYVSTTKTNSVSELNPV